MRRMRIRTVCFATLIATVSVAGCATSRSDFVVALPNGYQIKRDKAAAPTIVKKSGGVVVPGPVASYTVIRDVVVGVVEPAATAATPGTKEAKGQKPGEKQGYFVLNTRTGEIGKGLSESAWNERLKGMNIAPSPELSPPVLPQ